MINRYSWARNVINSLTDERRYEFTLTGKFEDVIGKKSLCFFLFVVFAFPWQNNALFINFWYQIAKFSAKREDLSGMCVEIFLCSLAEIYIMPFLYPHRP